MHVHGVQKLSNSEWLCLLGTWNFMECCCHYVICYIRLMGGGEGMMNWKTFRNIFIICAEQMMHLQIMFYVHKSNFTVPLFLIDSEITFLCCESFMQNTGSHWSLLLYMWNQWLKLSLDFINYTLDCAFHHSAMRKIVDTISSSWPPLNIMKLMQQIHI
jgi:hypothetical protein